MNVWPPPALVLCAGLGTRLRPLTEYRAKPAMPVGDDVLVGYILRDLATAGITDAVLNLHHLPATVTREIGDGTQYGVRVRYSWEQPRVLGSAGGPRHALPLLDGDTVLIVNGDTLCDLPVRQLWERHHASGALVTLGLMPHPAPGRYGGVTLDADVTGPLPLEGRVTGFVPRTSTEPSVHFPGIQVVDRSVFAAIPDDTPAETVLGIYPQLMADRPGSVHGVVFDARFEDVGRVDDYLRACRALAGDAAGNVVASRASVHPDAVLRHCVVWPEGVVPSGCELERVVVTGHMPLTVGATLIDQVA